jgi:hypothetical protein
LISGGDASIVAVGSTPEQTLETWYDGGFGGGWFPRGWWGGPGLATTTVERTPAGTLHVDIFDGPSKKVIWHGSSSDPLSGAPEKNEKKLEKQSPPFSRNSLLLRRAEAFVDVNSCNGAQPAPRASLFARSAGRGPTLRDPFCETYLDSGDFLASDFRGLLPDMASERLEDRGFGGGGTGHADWPG